MKFNAHPTPAISEADRIFCREVIPTTPIVMINTKRSGAGDLYQPENRICADKEIWFTPDQNVNTEEFTGNGTRNNWTMAVWQTWSGHNTDEVIEHHDAHLQESLLSAYVGAELMQITPPAAGDTTTRWVKLYAASPTTGGHPRVGVVVGSAATPEAVEDGYKLVVTYKRKALTYYLPVQGATILSVDVCDMSADNPEWVRYTAASGSSIGDTEYSYNSAKGYISFGHNIGVYGNDQVNANTIKVRYSLANAAAKKAIDDCYISNYFGTSGLEQNCVVMAGSKAQPNAVFWSGNSSYGCDPGYFPIETYNLVGEYDDYIVQFGRQQNKLVVFQTRRISALTYVNEAVDERAFIALQCRTISDQFGCDLPNSVQLIENNLVWASRKFGILYLKDSTYAYETLVAPISENINIAGRYTGDSWATGRYDGLLEFIRSCGAFEEDNLKTHCSLDDGRRYWLFIGKRAFVWDYSICGYTTDHSNLSWWYLEYPHDITAAVFDNQHNYDRESMKNYVITISSTTSYVCGMNDSNRDEMLPASVNESLEITSLEDLAIAKSIRTQTLGFGGYANTKEVDKMAVTVKVTQLAGNSHIRIKYYSDHEEREDLTPIATKVHPGSVIPAPFIRRPKCLHVQSFAVEFFDETPGCNMAIECVQIFYKYTRPAKGTYTR